MGRGGKAISKRRIGDNNSGSDDSDEDYVVSDEENEVSGENSEGFCDSLDGDASEESFGSFVDREELEEEEEVKKVKKVVKLGAKKGSLPNGKAEGNKTTRKRKRVSYEEEDDDGDDDYIYDEKDDDVDGDDDDEEFVPCQDDYFDEEEESRVKREKKTTNLKGRNRGMRKKGPARSQKRRKKTVFQKKPLAKKGRNNRRLKRKARVDNDAVNYDDFLDNDPADRKGSKKNLRGRKRKLAVSSDTDFVSSGSSDYEYTISEEEREQIREAGELCPNLRTHLRSSLSSKIMQEDRNLQQQINLLGRKGKEKIEGAKCQLGKQVCGICFSEEDKRRLRGTLDCCSHYFCFTCIMEWSKVESRCPLCKQRFKTITKPARSAVVGLRDVLIQIPERDQVYQPSEEELRSYLDPYENVICAECHEGGDDGLMLLCDLCDSSAHTYCVGLGWQVPEGNWYCEGCRPFALGSSSSQAQVSLSDQRMTSNNVFGRPFPVIMGGSLDPSLVSPRTPSTQAFGNTHSPRFPVGEVPPASPASLAGAPTLSGRRWIHRQIQYLLSMSRMNPTESRTDGISTANLATDFLNSQIDQDRETARQNTRAQDMETSHCAFLQERLQNNSSTPTQSRDFVSSGLSHLRLQAIQDPPSTVNVDECVNLTLWPYLGGINSMLGNEELRQFSRSSVVLDGNLPPCPVRQESQFYMAKEQLQSLVKSHLKNLSRDVDLDNGTYKEIARSSTHTILAACGLDHKKREVHALPAPPNCTHDADRAADGQTSLMEGCCSSCFDSFVRYVVKSILDTRMPQWLSLGL
ncbi:RING/U-box protein putative isoform 2 [Tripterygium wilfordii]|uniref:RING/U-box protein putative isoform 2 n=1 Tax=Tripterygium wilfordii TaxID=458696 RepID=A0A7J7D0K6_TRIWF|nr:uncharacterized protein LOC120010117 [Tripterygium wilfordii]KAF5739895.1 RING/U-box protein putative isoform 2 [Tripterygium wilfordii]